MKNYYKHFPIRIKHQPTFPNQNSKNKMPKIRVIFILNKNHNEKALQMVPQETSVKYLTKVSGSKFKKKIKRIFREDGSELDDESLKTQGLKNGEQLFVRLLKRS